jgi:hypothetical protein
MGVDAVPKTHRLGPFAIETTLPYSNPLAGNLKPILSTESSGLLEFHRFHSPERPLIHLTGTCRLEL